LILLRFGFAFHFFEKIMYEVIEYTFIVQKLNEIFAEILNLMSKYL